MMPRFLNIDFLSQAIQAQKAMLSRMLIELPSHLKEAECYLHEVYIPDALYRKPWVKEVPDTSLDLETAEKDIEDMGLPHSGYLLDIESFNRNSDALLHGQGDWNEIVPSSNPNSPSSVEECPLNTISEYGMLKGEKTFYKEPLTFEANLNHDMLLEETISSDLLCLSSIPQIDTLLLRLHPKMIKDPFFAEDGQPLTENRYFSKDFTYNTAPSPTPHSVDTLFVEERYNRESISLDPPGLLESDLNLISAEKDEIISITDFMPTCQQLAQILNLDEELEKGVFADAEDGMPDLKMLLSTRRELGIEGIRSMEASDELSSPGPSFIQLNDDGKECPVLVNKYVLESPILASPKVHIPNEVIEPWSDLTSSNISGDHNVDQTSVHGKHDPDILTESQRDDIENSLWKSDMYLTDSICMRIPEPDIKTDYLQALSVCSAMEALGVTSMVPDCSLELELCWDLTAITAFDEATFEGRSLYWHPEGCRSAPDTICEVFEKCVFDEEIESLVEPHTEMTLEPSLRNDKEQISVKNSNRIHHEIEKSPDVRHTCQTTDKFSSLSLSDTENQIDNFLIMATGEMLSHKKKIDLPKEVPQPGLQPDIRKNEMPQSSGDGGGTETWSDRVDHKDGANPLNAPCTTNQPSSTKIIQIVASGTVSSVLSMLDDEAQPLMAQLSSNGLLSNSQQFITLKPNITHYMLKQHKKFCMDLGNTGITPLLSALQYLHVLTCVFDLTLHVSLSAAVTYLTRCQDKSQHLTGTIQGIKQKLCREHYNQQQRKELHPKMENLCSEFVKLFARENQAHQEHRPKVLVVLKRHEPSLVQELCNILDTLDGVTTYSLDKIRPYTTQQLLKLLNVYNCLICTTSDLQNDLPWTRFSTLVEYEHRPEHSVSVDLSQRHHISFIGLTAVYEGLDRRIPLSKPAENTPIVQYVLIGSQRIIPNQELLMCLEKRHNITIYERDYTLLNPVAVTFADLVLNECHGIVLEQMSTLGQPHHLSTLTDRLVGLSLQYTHCSLLLVSEWQEIHMHSSCNCSTLQIAKLHGLVNIINRCNPDFQLKIYYCYDVSETGDLIRRLTELVYETVEGFRVGEWLSHTMTKGERFLLTIPCLNSISAQRLLTLGSLQSLFTMDYDSLVKTCFRLAPRAVKYLYDYVRTNQSIQRLSPVAAQATDKADRYVHTEQHILNNTWNTSIVSGSERPDDQNDVCRVADVDEGMDTLELLPSQPGPNEYEKLAMDTRTGEWSEKSALDLLDDLSDDVMTFGDVIDVWRSSTSAGSAFGSDGQGPRSPDTVPDQGVVSHRKRPPVQRTEHQDGGHCSCRSRLQCRRLVDGGRCVGREYRSNRTPSIAPVTPTIRCSVETLRTNARNEQHTEQLHTWQLCEEGSPPMDMDSPTKPLIPPHQRMVSSSDADIRRPSCHGVGKESRTTKKRRLVYESVPGSKGQTKLSFI